MSGRDLKRLDEPPVQPATYEQTYGDDGAQASDKARFADTGPERPSLVEIAERARRDVLDPSGGADGDQPRRVTLTPASAIEIDRPRWAWDRRIPVGGTTLMPGREGLGKTALAGYLAARLTRGQLPGEWHGRPADVIYIGTEDDRSTVLVPRLVAAGADLDRFHFVDVEAGATFSVSVDLGDLAAAVRKQDREVALVVLDPLDSHLTGVDSHRKAEVQAAVAKLAAFAQELRCGALGLGHLNKSDVRELLRAVIGSVGFTTSVRSVIGVGAHPDNEDEKVCVVGKANMTADGQAPAVRFRVEEALVDHPDGGDPISTGQVVILGEEDGLDPNSILPSRDTDEERSALDDAREWLLDALEDGPRRKRDLLREARRDDDIRDRTMERAAKALGVVVERAEDERGRPATWRLPDSRQGVTRQPPLAGKNPSAGAGSDGYSPTLGSGEKPLCDRCGEPAERTVRHHESGAEWCPPCCGEVEG